jgi:hypothetical protein
MRKYESDNINYSNLLKFHIEQINIDNGLDFNISSTSSIQAFNKQITALKNLTNKLLKENNLLKEEINKLSFLNRQNVIFKNVFTKFGEKFEINKK